MSKLLLRTNNHALASAWPEMEPHHFHFSSSSASIAEKESLCRCAFEQGSEDIFHLLSKNIPFQMAVVFAFYGDKVSLRQANICISLLSDAFDPEDWKTRDLEKTDFAANGKIGRAEILFHPQKQKKLCSTLYAGILPAYQRRGIMSVLRQNMLDVMRRADMEITTLNGANALPWIRLGYDHVTEYASCHLENTAKRLKEKADMLFANNAVSGRPRVALVDHDVDVAEAFAAAVANIADQGFQCIMPFDQLATGRDWCPGKDGHNEIKTMPLYEWLLQREVHSLAYDLTDSDKSTALEARVQKRLPELYAEFGSPERLPNLVPVNA